VEAGLVTVEQVELGGGGQVGEGVGDALGLVAGGLIADGLFHQAILDGPGAAHAPIGGNHFLDHGELDAIGGGETLLMLGDELVEALTRFVFQDNALGQETVAEGVGGGAFFPLRGDGASGAGSVGSRRVDSSK
jgi:hypothetical protein